VDYQGLAAVAQSLFRLGLFQLQRQAHQASAAGIRTKAEVEQYARKTRGTEALEHLDSAMARRAPYAREQIARQVPTNSASAFERPLSFSPAISLAILSCEYKA
jgi:hypothetical protein